MRSYQRSRGHPFSVLDVRGHVLRRPINSATKISATPGVCRRSGRPHFARAIPNLSGPTPPCNVYDVDCFACVRQPGNPRIPVDDGVLTGGGRAPSRDGASVQRPVLHVLTRTNGQADSYPWQDDGRNAKGTVPPHAQVVIAPLFNIGVSVIVLPLSRASTSLLVTTITPLAFCAILATNGVV